MGDIWGENGINGIMWDIITQNIPLSLKKGIDSGMQVFYTKGKLVCLVMISLITIERMRR